MDRCSDRSHRNKRTCHDLDNATLFRTGKSGGSTLGTKKADELQKATATERDNLAKEKQKLADEINRLKKELTDAEKQRKTEKEELEKSCKEKAKLVEKLQTELDVLKAQVGL